MNVSLHSVSTDNTKSTPGFHSNPQSKEIFLKVTLDNNESILDSLSRIRKSLNRLKDTKVEL